MKSGSTDPTGRFYYGHIVVIVSTFIFIGAFGVNYAFGVFFTPLLEEFGWTRAVTSGAVALSWIVQTVGQIFMGKLNDRYGPRKVLSFCGLVLGTGYFLMSQVSSLWQFYAVYGLIVGIGLSGIFVPLTSTVARWFITRRSSMTGIIVAGVGVGTLIGPLISNWLIGLFDWRVSYSVLGIVVFVVIVTAAQFLKHKPSPISAAQTEKLAKAIKIEGMDFVTAVRQPQFYMFFAALLCFGTCLYFILVHITAYAIGLGISAAAAAGLLSAIGGMSIAAKIISGKIGDIYSNRVVFIIGFSAMAVSFLIIMLLKEVWALYLFAMIFGLAYGACVTAQSPIVAEYFGLKSHGLILGTATGGLTIGGAAGPIMAGYIFDTTGSYEAAFIVSLALSLAGLVIMLMVKPIRSRGKTA
jgi:MFS family permease